MNPTDPSVKDQRNDVARTGSIRRRHFLAIGAGLGATMLAGCSTEAPLSDGADGGTTTSDSSGATAATGTFRLLISDQPTAIDDFDSLDVSFDRARIFRGEGADGDGDANNDGDASDTSPANATKTDTATLNATETATAAANETEMATANATATATETASEPADDADDGQRGFFVIDLGGATVDLTQVVGDKAMGVFDGELPEGRYTKIELYAASVEGVVDGEPVDVMIPSGKLQIVKPFEVVAGETLSFVFDINVVEKGQTGEYNLLPVISGSGVAGKDVEVENVGNARGANAAGGTDDTETEDEEPTEETPESEGENGRANESDQGNGRPDDGQGDS